MDDFRLDLHSGLPQALRVLLAEYPRDGWATDPNFQGLVAFWLDRHMMFRRVLALTQADAEALLNRSLDRFVKGANAVLRCGPDRSAMQDSLGRFHTDLIQLGGFLNRHLIDEEELIVPIILRHGAGSLG